VTERAPSDDLSVWCVLRGHFLEMPGLSLTISEASRRIGLSAAAVTATFRDLEQRRFLTRTHDRYHCPSA